MSSSVSVKPRIRVEHLKEIDIYLEEIFESGATAQIGAAMRDCKMEKSQVRGLENLIASTRRFSEIVNYVKNQTGKEKKLRQWRAVAPSILEQLTAIGAKAAELAEDDASAKIDLKLVLVRGWARQVIACYLYGNQNLQVDQP